ncbi:MAG: alpha/beta fold hydrolase [Candidatus Thiodiazotropha sp. (ex Monitilora ramsayi)]|nr:alpha/beta fold hydrolase [Candidatus Thiodiazotropha sp. (ex Monitilora ramsayi)]
MPNLSPMKVSFKSRDGFPLHGEWHPAEHQGASRKIAIISPGMGVPARFYRPFARFLAKSQIEVLIFDFRGIGWSAVEDLKQLRADATMWGSLDLAAAIDFAKLQAPDSTLVGIGHSFGGSIFGFTENIRYLQKLVHVCSQSGFYGLFSWKVRLYHLFNIYLSMPILTRWLGYYPAHWLTKSEALPAGFVAEWAAWCQRPDYFMDSRFNIREKGYHGDYTAPLLSLSFSDDSFATRNSVDRMASFYSNSQIERRHLSPSEVNAQHLGHFEVFRPSNGRIVWKMIAEWIQSP